MPSLLVLSVPLVLACAGQQTVVVWEKPGATPGELEAARNACLAEVDALHADGVSHQRLEAEVTGACFVACMKRHGFTWRTEKVSTREEAQAEREVAPAAAPEPYDAPLPASPECSAPPLPPAPEEGGRGGE